jgi:predicted enzyme related to lactoylglutathione lyase
MSNFVHYELNTSDPKAAKKFYQRLFGWKFQDMKTPSGVYMMFMTEGGQGGGIQAHPMPGSPSAWLQYVGVRSVKHAMAEARKLGATTLVPYHPVPGYGALGVFEDPTGAACAVWEAATQAAPEQKAAKKAPAKKVAKKAPAKKAAKKAPARKPAKKAPAKKAAKKAPAKKAAKKAPAKRAKKRARR